MAHAAKRPPDTLILCDRRIGGLRQKLLAWFRKDHRDLPWRRTTDPYAIWVSEVMLQQTQVATVIPYYERFLARFPTVAALAAASEHNVMKAWQGLGYYRRAGNLRAAAKEVVRNHGGRVPDDPAAFAALLGVGRYTCGAVQSIAFGRRMACLDGNAVRVFARWMAITDPVTDAVTQKRLWAAAERLVPEERVSRVACSRGRMREHVLPQGRNHAQANSRLGMPPVFPDTAPNNPGDWNQAVMEFGATVCTPRAPQCTACPVKTLCRARGQGLQEKIPRKRRKKPIPHIQVGAGIVWRRGKILLCKRLPDAMLGGLWEFPGGKQHPGETIPECIRRELKEECDLDVTVGDHLVDVTHTYSHLRVTLRVYHARSLRGRVKRIGCADSRWVRPEDIPTFPLPAADIKILEALGVSSSKFQVSSETPQRQARRASST